MFSGLSTEDQNIFFILVSLYERNEFEKANNQYNCPIVTSYPENIKNNMDPIVNRRN